MHASSQRQPLVARPARRPLVGLTPLIDVVFILLVFFMLASSFADWRRIELRPPAEGDVKDTGLVGAALVEILDDGRVRLSGEVVALEDLGGRAEALLEKRPGQRFVVKTANETPLQALVAVLDRLTAAGAEAIAFTFTGKEG